MNGSEKSLVLEEAAAKALEDNSNKTEETRFFVLVEWAEPNGDSMSMDCWVKRCKVNDKPEWTVAANKASQQLSIGTGRKVSSLQGRHVICEGSVESYDGIFFFRLDGVNANALQRHSNVTQFRVRAEWKGSDGGVESAACWVEVPVGQQNVDGFRGKWWTMAVDEQSRVQFPPVDTKVTLWDRSPKKLHLEKHVIEKAITGDLDEDYDVTLLNKVLMNMKALHPLLPTLSKELRDAKDAIVKPVAALKQAMEKLEELGQTPSGNEKEIEKIKREIEGKRQTLRKFLSAKTPDGRSFSQAGDIILELLAQKLSPSKGEEKWETKWCTCIDDVVNAISNKTLSDDTLSSLTKCLDDMLNQLGPVDKVKAIDDKMIEERTARNTKYAHAPKFRMDWKDFQELSGCYVALAVAIDAAYPDLNMTQTTCKINIEKAIDELLKNAAKAATNVQLNDKQLMILGAMFETAELKELMQASDEVGKLRHEETQQLVRQAHDDQRETKVVIVDQLQVLEQKIDAIAEQNQTRILTNIGSDITTVALPTSFGSSKICHLFAQPLVRQKDNSDEFEPEESGIDSIREKGDVFNAINGALSENKNRTVEFKSKVADEIALSDALESGVTVFHYSEYGELTDESVSITAERRAVRDAMHLLREMASIDETKLPKIAILSSSRDIDLQQILGKQLVNAGIKHVVIMKAHLHLIKWFSDTFYRQLLAGKSVGESVRAAFDVARRKCAYDVGDIESLFSLDGNHDESYFVSMPLSQSGEFINRTEIVNWCRGMSAISSHETFVGRNLALHKAYDYLLGMTF